MTSNAGSPYILEQAGRMQDPDVRAEVEAAVMQELRRTFRPEFLNRVDEIIVFRPLSPDDLMEIVDLQLTRVESLLAERKLSLTISDEAKRLLSEEGYDVAYGARPLKRTIQRLIMNPLAIRVLEGEFDDGDLIRIDRVNGSNQLLFEKAGEVGAAARETAPSSA
jgi:ATP-dependent Clp protease ATP-binding subunit ClpB